MGIWDRLTRRASTQADAVVSPAPLMLDHQDATEGTLVVTKGPRAVLGKPTATPVTEQPLSPGLAAGSVGTSGEWNPWSMYQNPIAAFYELYETNVWVRGVCDKLADEVHNDGWQLSDEQGGTKHPMYAQLYQWLVASGFDTVRQRAALDLTVCSNAFFLIQRNGLGQVLWLEHIPANTLRPVGDPERGVVAWIQNVGYQYRMWPAEDIWHIKNFNPLSAALGLPKLTSVMTEVDADRLMAIFNRSYFGNGTSTGTILTWDNSAMRNPVTGEWEDEDEVKSTRILAGTRAYMEKRYQNPTAAHLPMILMGKWQVHGTGQAKADAQFLDGRKFNMSLVCTVYGFPPEALGHGQRGPLGGNLADSAAEQLDAAVLGIHKLIDNSFVNDFLIQRLGIVGLRTGPKPRPAKITVAATVAAKNMATTGVYTRNEIRAVTGHTRLPDGGDVLVQITPSEVVEQPDLVVAPPQGEA